MYLNTRTATVGNQIPARGETHGEELVTALDIPLTDIMLDESELGDVLRQPRAADALFDRSGGVITPFFEHIKPIALSEKIEGASVSIMHGIDKAIVRFVDVKLAKIKLEPLLGGLTAMSCTLQCTPDLNEDVALLLGRINQHVDVEIEVKDYGKQTHLKLEVNNDDKPAHDEVGARRRRANEPAAAASEVVTP